MYERWQKVSLAVLLIGLPVLTWRSCVDEMSGIDRALIERFEELELGCDRQRALAWMRTAPGYQTNVFFLGQYPGNEREYERASNSTARLFVTWRTGPDLNYVLGFDTNDILVVKCSGGT